MDIDRLKILSDSEIQSSAFVTNDRGVHGVYRIIRELSTPKSAEKGNLFDPEITQINLPHFDGKQLPAVLGRLEREGIVVSLPAMTFETETGKILTRQLYFTRPATEAGRLETLVDNLIHSSVNALFDWVRVGAVADDILADLEKDRNGSRDFQLFLPLKEMLTTAGRFVPIDPGKLQFTLEAMQEKIERSDKLYPLGANLYLPSVPGRDHLVLEASESYLDEQIFPLLVKQRAECCQDYRKAAMEERFAAADERKKPTATFAARKARSILNEFGKEDRTGEPVSLLAARVILALEARAEELYEEYWKKECRKEADEFVQGLSGHGGNWRLAIRFVSARDVLEMVPDVWKLIQEDPTIYQITWERPASRFHILMAGDPDVFWLVFRGLLELGGSESWKIAAVKTLVERYESRIKALFRDQKFVKLYGQVLRKAYIRYMPFYLRPFMTWKIPFFHRALFARARKKIEEEQTIFGRKNEVRLRSYSQQLNESTGTALRRMVEQSYRNTILVRLDQVYFEEGNIPLSGEILRSLPEIEPTLFWKIVKNGGFRMIPAGGVKSPENTILIHPADQDWRSREARILKLMDHLKKRAELLGSDGDPVQGDRATRLESTLLRNRSAGSGSTREKGSEDPYDRFKSEMEKHREESSP